MKKFVYLILHYISIDETKKCVESIISKSKKKNYDIVIVDNASPNNSGLQLKEVYKNNKNIHIILNKKNL